MTSAAQNNNSSYWKDYPEYKILKDADTFNTDELLATKMPPRKFIVDKIMDDEGMDITMARAKDLKTYLELHKCACIATGRPFLGLHTEKGKILYIDEENGIRRLQRRIEKIVIGLQLTESELKELHQNLIFSSLKNIVIDDIKHLKQIIDLVTKHQPILIVCDSLVRVRIMKENESGDARVVFQNLKKICSEAGMDIKFNFLHHVTKSSGKGDWLVPEDARGSGDFMGQVNTLLILERDAPTNNGVQFFRLRIGLSRDDSDSGFIGIKFKIYDKLFADKPGIVFESYGTISLHEIKDKKIKKSEKIAQKIIAWARNSTILPRKIKREDLRQFDDESSTSTVDIAIDLLVERKEMKESDKSGWYEVVETDW